MYIKLKAYSKIALLPLLIILKRLRQPGTRKYVKFHYIRLKL